MNLNRILRLFEPLPTTNILAVSLPFLVIGLVDGWKASELANRSVTAAGTVINHEKQPV
jgi:hypothetical protein